MTTIRRELSFFLKNVPGELSRLAALLRDKDVNIEAITIQDASDYVMALFKARGKSLKRIASTASYESMQRDSSEFALVRIVVSDPDKTIGLLAEGEYIFDVKAVIVAHLENTPGEMAEITSRLSSEGININYVYGSVAGPGEKCLFVLSTEDPEKASAILASLG
jgi:hypothetical protein